MLSTLQIVLYCIWALLPLFYFGMALWSKLESLSNADKPQNPGDFIRQGVFVTLAVFAAIFFDQFILEWVCDLVGRGLLPPTLFRIVLLPLVLLALAKITGPTRAIKINRVTHVSKKAGRTKAPKY